MNFRAPFVVGNVVCDDVEMALALTSHTNPNSVPVLLHYRTINGVYSAISPVKYFARRRA